jgi:large subunit ribosomal protein L10
VLTRAQKETQVAELRDKLGRATSVFVADYRGIDVESVNKLRRRLRTDGEGAYEYGVMKNTLLRLAVVDSEAATLAEAFQGPTAVAIAYGDPVRLAKILVDYAKEHEVFELRAGWLEGRTIGRDEIATLATLPSLEELRARLVGLLQAPATQLAQLLTAPGAQIARLAEARRKQLEESGATS